MQPLRIVLADDHVVVRQGIKALIDAEPTMTVVGEAGDGAAACRLVEQLAPDVLVLDVTMPVMTGVEVARRARELQPSLRIVALTVHDDRAYISQLLKAGAHGYVLKRAAAHELIHAIRTVAGGGMYLDPQIAATVAGGLVGRDLEAAGDESLLSNREHDVLRRVAQGYSNKEIAAQLGIGVRTVETYKARIIEKLGLRSRADIVRFAMWKGWLTPEE